MSSSLAAFQKTKAFELLFLISEVIVVLLYGFCTEYSDTLRPQDSSSFIDLQAKEEVQRYYPIFQDVHVMIFVGFGFLMVFLKTHCWTSVGYNFLIAAYALQLTPLLVAFWHSVIIENEFNKITLDITTLIIGDFGAGAVLITFGAILGKCSLHQLWILATMEIFFYALNEEICAGSLGAVDMGGSMYVHMFGAYFGLAASYFFKKPEAHGQYLKNVGGYTSQTIAMLGTLFLWMFWPSFNGALASASQQERVIVNTVLSITASCITACATSRFYFRKLDMEIVLNATLAGGVAVGSSSDLVVGGGLAMAIGALAGICSALGFVALGNLLENKLGLEDTCGVHNLHGMPGVLGATIGAFSAGFADSAFDDMKLVPFPKVANGDRTLGQQAGYQIAAMVVSFAIATVAGALSGYVASKLGGPIQEYFDDRVHWHECPLNEVHDDTAMPSTSEDTIHGYARQSTKGTVDPDDIEMNYLPNSTLSPAHAHA